MNFLRIYRSSAVGRIADWTSLVQFVVTILGLFGGGALLTWAASSIDPIMRYGWGAAVFSGLAAACAIVLTLSVGAFGLRTLLLATSSTPLTPSNTQATSTAHSDAQLDTIVSEFDAFKSITQLHYEDFDNRFRISSQKIGQSIEKLAQIERMLAPARPRTLLETLGTQLSKEENRFESIANDIKILSDRINNFSDTATSQRDELSEKLQRLNDDTHETFKKIQQVLHFERVLESYNNIARDVEQTALKMDDPLSKPHLYEDWNIWSADYASFKSQLATLDRLLKTHTSIRLNIFETAPEKYSSQNWTYNFQSMSDDQKLNYKTYKILFGNYLNSKEEVKSKLYDSTFLRI